jgi:CO/xanthine dehydrogenase Mo-binding subunit
VVPHLGNIPKIPLRRTDFLLDGTVRFAGEEIACVIAEDADQQKRPSKDFSGYEQLPFVLDPEEALNPGLCDPSDRGRSGSRMSTNAVILPRFEEAEVIVEDLQDFNGPSQFHGKSWKRCSLGR